MKNTTIYLLCAFLFFFGLQGCWLAPKYDPSITDSLMTHFEGRIIDSATKKGIGGVEVCLCKDQYGMTCAPELRLVTVAITDSEGKFRADMKVKNSPGIILSVASENFRNLIGGNDYRRYVTPGQDVMYYVSFWQIGYFNLRIKNKNPAGPDDLLTLRHNNTVRSPGGDGFWTLICKAAECDYDNDRNKFWMNDGDASIANKYTQLEWTVLKKGVTTTYTDRVLIKPRDTIIYTINY